MWVDLYVYACVNRNVGVYVWMSMCGCIGGCREMWACCELEPELRRIFPPSRMQTAANHRRTEQSKHIEFQYSFIYIYRIISIAVLMLNIHNSQEFEPITRLRILNI